MILPRHITGFWTVEEERPPTNVDGKLFQSACYAVARAADARVMAVDTDLNPGRNYLIATLQLLEHPLCVLCNIHFPLIAFATEQDGFWEPDFVDKPELAHLFEQMSPFQVLESSLLEQQPEPDHLTQLSEAEISQICQWKPSRLGDIIFNCWD
jgi:hypothetical protein